MLRETKLTESQIEAACAVLDLPPRPFPSVEAIQKAFRIQAKQYHEDIDPQHNPENTEHWLEVSAAYDELRAASIARDALAAQRANIYETMRTSVERGPGVQCTVVDLTARQALLRASLFGQQAA